MKNMLEHALKVASEAHKDQMYGTEPYMTHVNKVVEIAQVHDQDISIQIACALHDVLEDTDLPYIAIRNAFGYEIAEIVYCVTDELGRNRKEIKRKTYPKIASYWKAVAVKLCDRIANLKDAILNNKRKYQMYHDEHDEFVYYLKIYDGMGDPNQKLWDTYYELIGLPF